MAGGGPTQGEGLIGATSTVARQNVTERSAYLFRYSPGMVVVLLEVVVAFGAFFLFGERRGEREFL